MAETGTEPAAAMPSWLPAREGERVLWRGGPRVQTVLPALVLGLLITAVPVGVALLVPGLPYAVALLGLLGPPFPLGTYLWVRTTEYVVTSGGLYRKEGFLGREVRAVSHESVQNVTTTQGIVGTVFGHGTVTFDTAGDDGNGLAFRYIDDIQVVQELASERRHENDRPGTIDQWRAVREEVRRVRVAVDRQAGRRE